MSTCGCVDMHDGMSHEEHMDHLHRQRNYAMLARANEARERGDHVQAVYGYLGFATEEQYRLELKLQWLKP